MLNFDAIAKQRIYVSINKNNFSTFKFLKDEYKKLKYRIGKMPMLMDFYNNGAVDPIILMDYSKSYYSFVKKVEKEYNVVLNNKEIGMLEYISSNIANGKRPHELIILEKLYDFENVSVESITTELKERYNIENDKASIYNVFKVLEGKNIAMKTESHRYRNTNLRKV